MTVLGASGCLFHRAPKQPKEKPDIATGTEREFQQRWVAKRVADLTAQGVAASVAEQQATQEFREKFSYAAPKGK